MALRRYVASGRGRPFAAPRILGIALVGGIVTGAIEGVASHWISLLILFPALIGAVAGGLAGAVIHRLHFRAPALAMVLGFVGGAAGYVAVHGVQYVRFRADLADGLKARLPDASEAALADAVDQALVAETGNAGFVGYLVFAAREGVTIKRVGVGDPGLRLPGVGALIVWAIELLIAALIAGFLARARAKEPFCEACDAWFGTPRFVASGGDASSAARRRFVAALEAGDVDAAAAAFHGPRGRRHNFALAAATCPRCAEEAYGALKRISTRRAEHAATLEGWLMAKDELARLTAALARPRT